MRKSPNNPSSTQGENGLSKKGLCISESQGIRLQVTVLVKSSQVQTHGGSWPWFYNTFIGINEFQLLIA